MNSQTKTEVEQERERLVLVCVSVCVGGITVLLLYGVTLQHSWVFYFSLCSFILLSNIILSYTGKVLLHTSLSSIISIIII